ncbi:MAG TPA: PaaI family thioesterase [Actinomycetota bacterium]|nr:PaaI family thioesterase [Actinomycetota bacterium]
MSDEVDERTTVFVRESMPLAATLAVELLSGSPDDVRGRIAWREELCTAAGAMHGGVLMSLADICGGTVAFLNLPEGASGTTTIESKTNFFRAVTGGTVTASSHALHIGRSTIVVETELRDDDDRLCAKTTQTQAVLYPRS